MKVQIRVEMLLVKALDGLGMWRRDVPVAHVLAHHRAILGLG
jgi:hypothetical protein